ncbi:MAG TPA: N-acetyltransferase [Tepidisphaeraceae bacterium]|nr:N-acetyltransferase [Tepidisphaeraceae bacterium]
MQQKGIAIRRLTSSDSLAELTALLHAAYAEHALAGRKFFASYQSVDDTGRRVSKGECWLAVEGDSVVGTVTVAVPFNPPAGFPAGPQAGTFSQLAVLPKHRGTGLGHRLLCLAEKRIAELGGNEIVIDTSSLASELIAWYERRGYRPVGRWKWNVTNYESVVLSKRLVSSGDPAAA